MEKKKVRFHQDDAPSHRLTKRMSKIHQLHFELLPNSSDSSDSEKHFKSNEEEKEAYYLQSNLTKTLLLIGLFSRCVIKSDCQTEKYLGHGFFSNIIFNTIPNDNNLSLLCLNLATQYVKVINAGSGNILLFFMFRSEIFYIYVYYLYSIFTIQ